MPASAADVADLSSRIRSELLFNGEVPQVESREGPAAAVPEKTEDTVPATGMGAVMAEGSGFMIGGRFPQFVPREKAVFAKTFGLTSPSPARPWPTQPGYVMA